MILGFANADFHISLRLRKTFDLVPYENKVVM